MATQQPLDIHQQELINVVKAAHQTLSASRKLKTVELARRLAENKIRLQREADESSERIRLDLDAEVALHAANQDEALIAAYNAGVPIRRLALEGFGNQYDGTVQALIVKLRADGRVGSREGYQRDTDGERTTVAFPEAVDVAAIINESTTIAEPTYVRNAEDLVVSEGIPGKFPPIVLPAVTLTVDRRDPYFKSIARLEIAGGSKFRDATTVTLYKDLKGNLNTSESREVSDQHWNHPVAFWVKAHPEEALAGFDAAIAATTSAAE